MADVNSRYRAFTSLVGDLVGKRTFSCGAPALPVFGCRTARQLSVAGEVVDGHERVPTSIRRLRSVHSVHRQHFEQHDERLVDCLTEARAFAWAGRSGMVSLR